ncbi:MAG: hypothetical protein ACRELT_18955 [Longimicrobiales bacterium]
MKQTLTALVLAALLPGAAAAQRDVTRRAYTFLEDRLVVAVHADAPGELQVIRGQRGRIEVAARSRDGFAGFGLGGDITRQLLLTALGSEAVQYLVVVPEHVSVSVMLPRGGSADVTPRDGVSTYRWGAEAALAALSDDLMPIIPSTAGGLYIIHSGRGRVPSLIDVPGLASVRSISIRVEGDDFRVASTRPLALTPGDAGHMVIRVDGQPLDLILFVPRGSSGLQVRSGSVRLADVVAGRPRSYCGGTVIQRPTPHQDWLTMFPADGRVSCR